MRIRISGAAALLLTVCLVPWGLGWARARAPEPRSPDAPALAAVEHYLAAFNRADLAAWAATLNFPHVRIAQGKTRIWQSAEEYTRDGFDFAALRAAGWHHSVWDELRVLQRSTDQVNLNVRFTRYRTDGTALGTFEAVYVVTRQQDHWGVQARASTAP